MRGEVMRRVSGGQPLSALMNRLEVFYEEPSQATAPADPRAVGQSVKHRFVFIVRLLSAFFKRQSAQHIT